MALKFPTVKEEEIPNWLSIKIHKVQPNKSQTETDEYGKRVGPEILLLAPQSVVENNIANYTSTDFKLSSAIASIGEKGGDWLEVLKGAGKVALHSAIPGMGDEISRMTSQIVNPRSEQFFTGPGFRQFTFHWELAPLSSGDAFNLQQIYKVIRKSSYPTVVTAGASMLYGMPDEFELKLIRDSGGNNMTEQEPKFGKCVVTNISINYTGAGINALSDSGAAPPFVNLDITFAERLLNHQDSSPIA